MSTQKPTRHNNNSTGGKDSINNMMVKNLLSGRGDFVRQLQVVGFRFDNVLDEVSAGTMTNINGHEVIRRSVWHWSHQSGQESGVMAWWEQLNKALKTSDKTARSPLISNLFSQAAEVASFSSPKTFPAFSKTWNESSKWFGYAPGWDVKTRNNLVISNVLNRGDVGAPFIKELFSNNFWTEKDFESPTFSSKWMELMEGAVRRYFPDLLSEMISNTPYEMVENFKLNEVSALNWVWKAWFDEHNRPQAMMMEDEGFYRLTQVLEIFLKTTPTWSDELRQDLHRHLPSLQKNREWQSLSSLIEQKVLESAFRPSSVKNKTHRI